MGHYGVLTFAQPSQQDDFALQIRRADIAARAVLESREELEPIIRDDVEPIARDAAAIEERTPEPEEIEERTCTYISICKREGEVTEREADVLYAREVLPDGDA